MRVQCLIIALSGALGCATPCTRLNAVITELLEGCDIPVTDEIADGGKGQCGVDSAVGECHEACWTAATCEELDAYLNAPSDDQALWGCVFACDG